MVRCCSHCQGTGIEPAASDLEIAAAAEGLRAACSALGCMATGDGMTDERGAAALLGRAAKTLSNWRHTDRPIPFVKRRGRVLYAFVDLARWNAENAEAV